MLTSPLCFTARIIPPFHPQLTPQLYSSEAAVPKQQQHAIPLQHVSVTQLHQLALRHAAGQQAGTATNNLATLNTNIQNLIAAAANGERVY